MAERKSIGDYLAIGTAVAAGLGVVGFCADVGGIKTATGRALAPYVEVSNKRKYDPVSVDGIDYLVVGKNAYLVGSVTPVRGDGRITLRQRFIGSVENWRDFDTAVRHLNGGKEPVAGAPYRFPSSAVPSDTGLYDLVIEAHAARQ
ncbi:hypothetical protein KY361_06100 [Candidatus Woesearchaeota archaeon]|nr:hypothetical protein [Candidatus Woesearchaeota archaeon]